MSVEDGRSVGEFHLALVPLKRMVQYNACDCHTTKIIEVDAAAKVPAPLVRVYTDAAFTVDRMQSFGPLLDFEQTGHVEKLYPAKKVHLTGVLRKLSKDPDLNPNSYPQMLRVLYEVWKLPKVGKAQDTSKETLKLLMQQRAHPGVKALQQYREAKNRTERIAAFRRSAEAHEGRVTTYWWLTGARTGRLASGGGTRPDKRNLGNLQNIPSDTHVKNMLVSSLDWRKFIDFALENGVRPAIEKFANMEIFLARDYSQMELRVLAQVADEKVMLKMFNSGLDIHAAIGSLWSGWSFKEIQKNDKVRRIVKALHFGIIYGLMAPGLRAQLLAQGVKLSRKTVQGYIDQYWTRFKKISRYRDQMPEYALEHGYVTNLFGFRVPIETARGGTGAWWKNQAVNAPIQGAAHQVLLCVLALMWRDKEKYKLIRPQMEIHDSLITVSRI